MENYSHNNIFNNYSKNNNDKYGNFRHLKCNKVFRNWILINN